MHAFYAFCAFHALIESVSYRFIEGLKVQVPPPALKQIIQNKHLNQKLMAVNSPIISIKYRKLILYVNGTRWPALIC
ncbi:MAG: hypothetical protein DMG13_21010 [Acidobacteria bacterium]|nr:MAG: hypothetical protein DMG13_21010 [Acidobacteriota bacterium]